MNNDMHNWPIRIAVAVMLLITAYLCYLQGIDQGNAAAFALSGKGTLQAASITAYLIALTSTTGAITVFLKSIKISKFGKLVALVIALLCVLHTIVLLVIINQPWYHAMSFILGGFEYMVIGPSIFGIISAYILFTIHFDTVDALSDS